MPEDNTAMSGGPGQADPGAAPLAKPAAAPPAQVEVTYGGKTFKTTPEIASVLNQAKADTDAARAAAARPPAAAPPAAVPPAPKAPAIDPNLMLTDPDRYTELVIEEAEKRASAKMLGAYQRDQFERDFWSTFDAGNPDLREEKRIAKSIWAENRQQWTREGLTGEQALARLAEMTRTEVTRIITKGGKNAPPKKRSEGPSDHTPPPAKADESEGGDEPQPYSFKSIHAARKAAREKPATTH